MSDSLYMPNGEFPQGLKDDYVIAVQQVGNIPADPIPNTQLWYFWVSTNGYTRPVSRGWGCDHFYYYPWREKEAPRPTVSEGRSLKVLVARGESGPNLVKACQKHRLTEVRLEHINSLDEFWPAFFGHKNFLDVDPSLWDLPSLIVSDGSLRNYPEIGAETIDPSGRFEKLSVETGIPFERI